jgi:pimeloyl-ACP methyl ester carboxylesterase
VGRDDARTRRTAAPIAVQRYRRKLAEDDPLVPPVNGRILARLIPNARLQMIDDGHLFMVTRPDETARVIEGFLSGQEIGDKDESAWRPT